MKSVSVELLFPRDILSAPDVSAVGPRKFQVNSFTRLIEGSHSRRGDRSIVEERIEGRTLRLGCQLKVSNGSREKGLSRVRGNCGRATLAAREASDFSIDGDEEKEEIRNFGRKRTVQQETLDILGWPLLCDAVARFASTAMGKEVCRGLSPPSAREESQALVDETSAAMEMDSILGGGLEFGMLQTIAIERGLNRASIGAILSGKELAAIATLLEVSQNLQRSVDGVLRDRKGGQDSLLPIASLVGSMVVHDEYYKLIRSKVDDDGTVKDTASAQVRQARIQARTIEQRLRELLDRLIREKLASEDVQDATDVDGRLCLVVASTGKGTSIPGLLFQGSGSTAFLEPSQAVPLNDKLAEARAEVQRAEYDVLAGITSKLTSHLNDIQFVLDTVVGLDVIGARGRYSSWIGGRKPVFVNRHGEPDYSGTGNDKFDVISDKRFLINLRRARHPLLVQQYDQELRKAKAKLKSKTKLLGRARARGGSTSAAAALNPVLAAVEEAVTEVAEVEARAPVPIDVRVSSLVRVVAITGPNTGGKTAAIKAIGLAALMAKVGLYVPAMDPVLLPWFDAVFADIGDEQSLGQSLSTFSGHLVRIKRIMAESTNESLVLLDELGAGTDPAEGSALGMALLESFAAGGSLLTMATTHHGELKTLKYSDHRFENASVEFDEERLAPTYKLLWGIPGRSNALNVASRLGLSETILSRAQTLYGTASAELNEVIATLEEAKLNFDESRETSEILTGEAREFHSQVFASAERLYEHKYELQSAKSDHLAATFSAAHSTLRRTVASQQNQRLSPAQSGSVSVQNQPLKEKKQRDEINKLPAVGQFVYLPKLGRDVKVLRVDTAREEAIVQAGFLQVKIGFKELQ